MQSTPDDLQPSTELDALFLERVEGFPRKKMFVMEWSTDLHYIPSGKPKRTHMIDAVPVPRVSRNDCVALLAIEHFCEKHGVWWSMQRTPPAYKAQLRYNVTLHGNNMPIDAQSAATLAHAIVKALLAAVGTEKEVIAHGH